MKYICKYFIVPVLMIGIFLFMHCTNEANTKYSLLTRDISLVSEIGKKMYDFQALQKRFEQVYGVCKRMDQEICDVILSTYCFIRHQNSSFSPWSLFKQTIVPTRPFFGQWHVSPYCWINKPYWNHIRIG